MSDPERSIEAVVFDMDGVLLDSEPIWRAVERDVFGTVGIEVTEDDLRETMGVRIADVVARWHARRPWADPSPERLAETIVDRVVQSIETEAELNEHALRAVDRLHGMGLRLALASSSPVRLITAVLKKGDLADRFEAVVSAEDEERGKPHPDVYRSAARALDVPPERCLAIEDALSGVRAAKAAGMLCIAVPAPDNPADFGEADLVLDTLERLDDDAWRRLGARPPPVGR